MFFEEDIYYLPESQRMEGEIRKNDQKHFYVLVGKPL